MMTTIHDMPVSDRPREKLVKYGSSKLSTEELIAIVLGSGSKGENSISLAKKVLKKISSSNLTELNYSSLNGIKGIGIAKRCEIVACIELGQRFLQNKKNAIYMTPSEVHKELSVISSSKKEHFVVLYLDSRHQELKREIVSVGTLNSSLVHPREVFEGAIKSSAAAIIIAHNHPSQNTAPSEQDIEVTKKLVKCGKILSIEVLDHVIVSRNEFFSFKENQLLF